LIMADYIYTFTGKKFYPLSPDSKDIDIADIAHALSLLCRANGHFSSFHSVAQHCIECCNEAVERGYGSKVALACLLHDASEAYMSDVTTPVKNELAYYCKCEGLLIDLIFEKYVGRLSDDELSMVWHLDKVLLHHEFYHFTGVKIGIDEEIITNPDFSFCSFEAVEKEFIRLFEKLTKEF